LRRIKYILFLLLCCTGLNFAHAQPEDNDAKLGNHYFTKGEFEKAEPYYEKVYKKYGSQFYFDRFFMTLFYQEKYDDCKKAAAKQLKRDPYTIATYFKLAMAHNALGEENEAENIYRDLIKDLGPIQSRVTNLGEAFQDNGLYSEAIETYVKGRKMMKGGYGFQLELAELYSLVDQPTEMIREYLDLLAFSPVYLRTIQNYLGRIIDFTDDTERVDILRKEILLKVQKYPDNTIFNEMFIWYYTQIKEFNGAVIQAKALDKKNNENGKKLMEIGRICQINHAYEPALKAYTYIEELGPETPYYYYAIENKLQIAFQLVTERKSYSKSDISSVAADFENALVAIENPRKSVGISMQLAKIYAFYLDETDKAMKLIKANLELPIGKYEIAEMKILLGDIYVVAGDIWEASLLYMQVENAFSEDVIGHEAKFKNAKVFYYDGEFDYAKAQLDVLKASTSKLIANNAMQLSLLLQDNLGIDTTQAPVQMYAKSDLLLQQNKFNEAIAVLDSLEKKYPFHSMVDEVLYKKAQIYEGQQKWTEAIELYKEVAEAYRHDILADDAVYRIAEIYYLKLDEFELAAEYYRQILFDFGSSLYSAEARQKYRNITAIYN
jgi:tetratricopeptide (TPR) repeat protein